MSSARNCSAISLVRRFSAIVALLEPPQSPHPSPGVQLRGGNRQIRRRPSASTIGSHLVAAHEASAIASAERTIARMACLRSAESIGQAVITAASSSVPSAIG